MSKEDMADAFRENVKTPNRFNTLLKKYWQDTGEDPASHPATFFPVGGTLRINDENFKILQRIYNENSSRINERE